MRLQCSVPDCCKPVHGQRLCPMHYARWLRIGSTNLRSRIDRFLTKVRFTDSCWLWQGGHTAEGYGTFWNGRRQVLAHRYLYEFCIGALPASLEIDHLCFVTNCVLPDHLEPTVHGENMRRAVMHRPPAKSGAERARLWRERHKEYRRPTRT